MKENIVYDSGVLAENSKAVLPFRIVVEKNCVNGMNEVVVKRITYKYVSGNTVEEVELLNGTVWKENE